MSFRDEAEMNSAFGRELAALRDGAGWAPVAADRVDLAGADRVRFLHNLVTCEVRELAAGRSARGFFTHVKGGVLSDVEVLELGDRFRLVLPPGRGAAIHAHLEKYRIVERVEIAERADLASLTLRGRRAPELLAALGSGDPGPGARIETSRGDLKVAVRGALRGREPRFELETNADGIAALSASVRCGGESIGARELSAAAFECARIEDGELRWGVDYDEENFPQETGDESAISYTKGCYLGQEVVARIHYRGGVQRRALGLRFAGELPEVGTAILHDGRAAGTVTSVARSPRFGPIGLALVHRRAGEPPARVELAGGGAAELAALPFGGGDSSGPAE
jgi:folate-binding protein YgfZ